MVPCDFNVEVETVIHPNESVAEFDSIEPHTYEKLQVRGGKDSGKKFQDNFPVGILGEGSNKLDASLTADDLNDENASNLLPG